jgi:hypothetical protein
MLTGKRKRAAAVHCGGLHDSCRRCGFWLISGVHLYRFSRKRTYHGRSEKEDVAVTPQYATLASCAQTSCLCRVSQLRGAEAPTPSLQSVWVLRRPRGGRGTFGDALTRKLEAKVAYGERRHYDCD